MPHGLQYSYKERTKKNDKRKTEQGPMEINWERPSKACLFQFFLATFVRRPSEYQTEPLSHRIFRRDKRVFRGKSFLGVCFWRQWFLRSFGGCLGTTFCGLNLRYLPASVSWLLALKACITTAWQVFGLLEKVFLWFASEEKCTKGTFISSS